MTQSTLPQAALESDLARELRQKIQRGELELPVLSQTASQVASMCMQGADDARTLASTLNRDPALAGHVLRVANSAKYAPAEPIVSLSQAVSRMGMATVGQIAFAVAIGSRVFNAPGHDDWVRQMWRHAALTGGWARELARAKRSSVEGAFVCGLLHDIGEPVLLQAAIDLLAKAKSTASRAELEPLLHELHASAGATLARAWKMAPWIAEAIEQHHASDGGASAPERAILRLADELALCTEGAEPAQFESAARERLDGQPALEQLSLYDDLGALLARDGAVRDFAGALQ